MTTLYLLKDSSLLSHNSNPPQVPSKPFLAQSPALSLSYLYCCLLNMPQLVYVCLKHGAQKWTQDSRFNLTRKETHCSSFCFAYDGIPFFDFHTPTLIHIKLCNRLKSNRNQYLLSTFSGPGAKASCSIFPMNRYSSCSTC